jgi:uncharacterized repeat protein (TIGR01451 family)
MKVRASIGVLALATAGLAFAVAGPVGTATATGEPSQNVCGSTDGGCGGPVCGESEDEGCLAIDKTGPESAAAGENVTYAITVTSGGEGDDAVGAQDSNVVTVTDTIPDGTTLVSAAPGNENGWTCTGTVDLTCTHDEFDGESSFHVTVHVASGFADDSIENCATASKDEGEGDEAVQAQDDEEENPTSCWVTDITHVSDLSIVKTGPATAVSGTNIQYGLTVTNNGPSDSGSVTVSDTLPAGVTLVSAAPGNENGWTCSGTTTLTCTHAGLVAGASSSFHVTVTVTATSGAVVNCASITGGDTSQTTANNTSCVNAGAGTTITVAATEIVLQPTFTG